MTFHVPEILRITTGPLASSRGLGNNGAFLVKVGPEGRTLAMIASDVEQWEHVSVSIPGHPVLPTWGEMCWVKNTFWDAEDCVVQYHPPKADYVNFCNTCLHLWAPIGLDVPRPPKHLVGGIVQ